MSYLCVFSELCPNLSWPYGYLQICSLETLESTITGNHWRQSEINLGVDTCNYFIVDMHLNEVPLKLVPSAKPGGIDQRSQRPWWMRLNLSKISCLIWPSCSCSDVFIFQMYFLRLRMLRTLLWTLDSKDCHLTMLF